MTKGTLLCVLLIGLTIVANSISVEIVPAVKDKDIKKCGQDKFECRSGRCIPKSWVCDQDSDCEDGDDETTCPTKDKADQCNHKTEYQCEVRDDKSSRPAARTLFHSLPASSLFTNICIPNQWLCDDCMHGDDENNCQNNKVNCTEQQFQCQSHEGHSSTCIPISWRCDGTADCGGSFDELNCTEHVSRECDPSIEFKCGNGKCIYNGWKCDGDDDCGDGRPDEPSSDEKECADKKPCDEDTHFKCKKVQFCILKSWRCDGEADCPDQSDEDGCSTVNPLHTVTCKANEFKCKGGSHCINKEFVCDGDNDCPDKSDESNCKTIECKAGFKACSPGICRLESDFCNGIKDCPKGEDEIGCPTYTSNFTHFCNPDTEYKCPETPLRCVPYDNLCKDKNSINDCSMSSVCGRNLVLGTCNFTESYCKCRDMYTKNGTVCTCPEGFENRNGACIDIDECKTPGSCDQGCENLPGSFRCHCHRGYRLVREDHALKATKCRAVGSDPLLLLSNRAAIRQYDMMTNRYQPLVNRLESAVAMDYWHKNETLIWSDVSKEQIMMCRMKQDGLLKNQTNCIDDEKNTTLVSNDVLTPDGLAVDWVHGLLFWTDTGLDKIYVLDLVTRHRRVIIDQGLDEPRAIAVDPSAGLIFWTDWGARARIERAGMDGKNRIEILSGSSIRWPNGLAVDILDKRIYWADAKIKTISSSDYYGRSIRTVLHSNEYLRHPFSLTVFEERLYWSDWDKEGVLTVNKFRGDDVKVMISGVSGPMTVRVYHEQAQPNDTNKCERNTCSHLCLPKAHIQANSSEAESIEKGFKPYICACATGYFVDTNDLTACIIEKTVAELSDSMSSSTIAMVVFLVGASICAIGLAGYVWQGRRARPFSSLQFENPVYRRTTEDPDAFEGTGDNSLGAFPSDVTNPPLLPSRLVLNQTQAPSSPLTNSNDFYHPNNYAYDQQIVRDETQNNPSA